VKVREKTTFKAGSDDVCVHYPQAGNIVDCIMRIGNPYGDLCPADVSARPNVCTNFNAVTEMGAGVAEADFMELVTKIVLAGFTSTQYLLLSETQTASMLGSLRMTAAEAFGVALDRVSATISSQSRRRLQDQLFQDLQLAITVLVPAEEAEALVATIATTFPTAASAAAVLLPAISASGIPASIAAAISITAAPETDDPVAYLAESYSSKKVRKLKKKCTNTKSWCDSVTLSGTKNKCDAYCEDGKCKAARKVKKSCKGRCKKACQAFLASPYASAGR